jgi:parallel beta-helix repeat protein
MKENMKKLTVLVAVVVMGAFISLGGGLALAEAPLVVDNDKVECPKAAFTTIQAAVDAASPGDKIRVCAGVYAENVLIGPTQSGITLKGDPGAILDGSTLGDGDGITLQSGVSDVTIKSFEIRNYNGISSGVGNAIQAWNCGTSNITIKENVIHDNSWNGILVGNEGEAVHTGWRIKENQVYNNGFADIELTNGKDSEIKGNTVASGSASFFDGILVQARNFDYGYLSCSPPGATVTSSAVKVSDNKVTGPYPVAGMDLIALAGGTVGPRKAVLQDVKVAKNEVDGARILARGFAGAFGGTLDTASDATSIRVVENDVHNSPVPGIHLSRVTDSNVTKNQANGNERGIVLVDSDNNSVKENTANNNTTYGVRLIVDSTGNTITENTATGNGTFDLFHDGSSTPNAWTDNTCGTTSGADIPPC